MERQNVTNLMESSEKVIFIMGFPFYVEDLSLRVLYAQKRFHRDASEQF